MVRRGVIDPRKNKLSSVIASLTDEELSAVFEEITDFKDSGILTKNSNLSRIARELHETFNVPYDLRMVEDDVLYEAARRFYNGNESAEWIEDPGLLPRCSACGASSDDALNRGGNYCHNCGNKMRNAR